MANLNRVASNVCIHWETPEKNPSLADEGLEGRCSAGQRFLTSQITCYNNGNCNGFGTCHDCSAYDVGGLQISHKETTHVYGVTYLLEWFPEQNKYLPVRELTGDEISSEEALSASLTWFQKTSSFNVSGEQVPFNLSMYNLRARFKKCCNWQGAPFEYTKGRNGALLGKEYTIIQSYYGNRSVQIRSIPYLPTDANGNYIKTNANSLARFCVVPDALPWRLPFTTENPFAYGCNGAKPECPFYTGPKWTHCVDSKMERGDKVSASQVQELRFYSHDWGKYEDPDLEFKKRFKDPVIFAWTGKFELGDDTAIIGEEGLSEDHAMVRKVYIDDFSGPSPSIVIGQPEPADTGMRMSGEVRSTVNFPTLIKELSGGFGEMRIVWPPRTTNTDPFVFRTFRIGQNVLRIFIETPFASLIYLVNATKHPQGYMTDAEFIDDMLAKYPDDLVTVAGFGVSGSVVYGDVELEYSNPQNIIKAYSLDPSSPTGAFLTDVCFVEHKLYHAHIIQTLGRDESGHPRLNPWIERFERVYCEAEIVPLANPPSIHDVLWDSDAGGKFSMYPTEEVRYGEVQSNWVPIGCRLAAVTFDNLACNAIYPWSAFGVSPRGVPLGMYLIRTSNPAAMFDGIAGIVPLKLNAQSYTGGTLPGNVVIVEPDLDIPNSKSKLPWSAGLDPTKDVIVATYYTTGYNQAPLEPGDNLKLKYPNAVNFYMDELPLEIELNDNKFSVRGSSICIAKNKTTLEGKERLFDLSGVKEEIYNDLLREEIKAIDSFHKGGVNDSTLQTSTQIFEAAKGVFEDKYAGYVFCKDGKKVTLDSVCERLNDLKVHEGDYTFLFVFKDETGRPIGAKKTSMLLQSAVAETRDVEIYYEWRMKLVPWVILDSMLLLAKFSEPLTPGEVEGSESYRPRCGDHSEEFLTDHNFGDPGPMWYPYMACLEPRYHEDSWNNLVKCKNYVEGFINNANTGSLEGKRWSYWERMRGNDMLTTHVAGPIFLVGCYYREVSYSYQLTDEQKFTGYTRIRSGHPHGPYSKDREALRVNRHFIKRNLKVRNETVSSSDAPYELGWTPEYEQLVFTDPNDKSKGIVVGDEKQTPIWIHLADGVSVVNRTTDLRQHPFTHYLLESVGSHDFSETFDEENRLKLSEVLDDRDLTSTQARRPDGTLIYSPGDPIYVDAAQNYNDIIPVYKDRTTAWGWLEVPKEPARGEISIGGVHIHNPSVNIWKKDRESAVYTEEGVNALSYVPPQFDPETGLPITIGYLRWAGGPERYIDWYTGQWTDDIESYGDTGVYTQLRSDAKFSFPGRGIDGTSFLADSTGKHKYIYDATNSGIDERYTVRGLGVTTPVTLDLLPYERSDLVTDIPAIYLKVDPLNKKFSTVKSALFDTGLFGHWFVESVDITFKLGPGTVEQENGQSLPVRFDIPKVNVYIDRKRDLATPPDTILVASSKYQYTTSSTIFEVDDASGATYTYKDAGYKKMHYSVGSFANRIRLQFDSLRADARAFIEELKIVYRKPIARTEGVHNYEQRVHRSTGNTGTPDYRQMLYYYSRTLVDFNDKIGYNLLEKNSIISTAPGINSAKFTNRTVLDVILEYEYYDPTGTRFPYGSRTHPAASSIASKDSEGYLTVPGPLRICTKSRTLYAGSHIDDNPQWVLDNGRTVENKKAVSSNETSVLCTSRVGPGKLGEQTQQCLYDGASELLGGDIRTVFTWFWHPDEVEFWEDTIETYLPKDKKLYLESKVSPFSRVFQHEHFGCTSQLSTPMSDGHLHQIPPWRALGHRVYTGHPLFNEACFDVVVFKIEEHIGESTYGTAAYGQNASSGGANWPWEAPKDREHYLQRGLIEKGGYVGGAIGGAGVGYWAAQTQLSHGYSLPQIEAQQDSNEQVYSGRIKSVRADASSSHSQSDEPPVGGGSKEFV